MNDALSLTLLLRADPADFQQGVRVGQEGLDRLRQEADQAARAAAGAAAEIAGAGAAARTAAGAQDRLATETGQVAQAASTAADAQGRLATETGQTGTAAAAAADAQGRLAAEMGQATQAAQTAATALERVGRDAVAVAQGTARAAAGHRGAAAAAAAHGQQAGFTRFQLLTLQYTINDIVASLASGTSPLTILAQQGGQVTQAFGGVRATLVAFAAAINPVVAGAAAAAAAVGSFAAAGYAYAVSAREVDRAVRAQGGAIGLTRDELERMARAAAEASGISVRAAREIEAVYVRSGRISAEILEELIGLTRDYAALTGQDLVDAAEELAEKLGDVTKGARELDAAYNILSAAQARDIANLVEQGRLTEAQRISLEALARRAKGTAEDGLNWLERAWDGVARAASNAWDWMGRASQRAPRAIELARLRQELARLQADASAGTGATPVPGLGERYRALTGQEGAQDVRAERIRQRIRLLEEEMRLEAEVAAAERKAAEERHREKAQAERIAALKAYTEEQERALQLARLGSQERAIAVAEMRAEAEVREMLKGAAAEEVEAAVAAARARARAAVEAGQATAEAERQAAAAVRDRIQAERDWADLVRTVTRLGEEAQERRDAGARAVEAYTAALDAETRQLGLSGEERAVVVALLQAEAAAKRAAKDETRELTEAERDAVEAAARRAYQGREAQRAAKEAERTAARSTDAIVEYAGDRFADLFDRQRRSWRDLWDDAVNVALRALARLVAEFALRPIVAPVVAPVQGTGAAAAGGVPAGARGGGFLDQLGGIGRLLSSGGGTLSTGVDAFGASLFPSIWGAGTVAPLVGPSTAAAAGVAAVPGGLSNAGTVTAAPGALAGTGFTFSNVLGVAGAALPGLISGNYAQAALGAGGALIGTMIAPGIGTAIGGLLGNLVGGLVGGKPPRDELSVTTGLDTGIAGPFGRISSDGRNTPTSEVARAVQLLDRSTAAFLSEREIAAVAAQLRGREFDERINRSDGYTAGDLQQLLFRRLSFGFEPLGGATAIRRAYQEAGADNPQGFADLVLQALQARDEVLRRTSGQSVEQREIAAAARAGIEDLTAAVERLRQAGADFGIDAGKTETAVRQMVEEFLGLRELPEAMSGVDAALAALNERLAQAAALARDVGISEAQLAAARQAAEQRLREGYEEETRRAILAIEDPLRLALEDHARLAEQRLEEARKLGADTVLIERRNALERARIIEQYGQAANDNLARQTDSLRQLLTDLTAGPGSPLAPETVLANAEERFAEAKAAALGGDAAAYGELADAARDLLAVARTSFASSPAYFQRFDDVIRTLQQLTAGSGGQANASLTALNTIGGRIAEGNEETRALRREVEALRGTVAAQQASIDRLLSRVA